MHFEADYLASKTRVVYLNWLFWRYFEIGEVLVWEKRKRNRLVWFWAQSETGSGDKMTFVAAVTHFLINIYIPEKPSFRRRPLEGTSWANNRGMGVKPANTSLKRGLKTKLAPEHSRRRLTEVRNQSVWLFSLAVLLRRRLWRKRMLVWSSLSLFFPFYLLITLRKRTRDMDR